MFFRTTPRMLLEARATALRMILQFWTQTPSGPPPKPPIVIAPYPAPVVKAGVAMSVNVQPTTLARRCRVPSVPTSCTPGTPRAGLSSENVQSTIAIASASVNPVAEGVPRTRPQSGMLRVFRFPFPMKPIPLSRMLMLPAPKRTQLLLGPGAAVIVGVCAVSAAASAPPPPETGMVAPGDGSGNDVVRLSRNGLA